MIKIFAGNFAPKNYMICEGQTLSIRQNTALYAVIGITYGGDGKDTFKLPDLRGRMIVGEGLGKENPGNSNSADLTYRKRGDIGGLESVPLSANQIPPHTHKYNALSGNRESSSPLDNFLGVAAGNFYASKGPSDQLRQMAPGAVENAGGGKGHNNMPPNLVINFIICVLGLYPPRP